MTKDHSLLPLLRFLPRRSLCRCLGLALALLGSKAQAADPALFALEYDAHFGGWGAESVRSLTQEENNGVYHMQAQSKILLLGKSVSTITEDAIFTLQDGLPQTRSYSFRQTGIGARERSVEFDYSASVARFQVKEKRGEIALEGRVHDELTTFLVLRQALERGETDIRFDVMDRDHVETHHYRVVSSEPLQTALGDFAAVHVTRLRDGNSGRSTEFWLARDYDYVLLKLEQSEPDGGSIGLEISGGTVNGMSLEALQETRLEALAQDRAGSIAATP